MSFEIIRNDITKVHADAIVNTANPRPTYGGGTDYAIYKAAGKQRLLEARKKIGDIARGEAAETPAFRLSAKYIIHTVGPVWEGGEKGEFDILRSCYENSLKLALKLGCTSVAFPLIATGVYGFPKDKALQIALSVIQPFIMEHPMKVTLVVFNKAAFELSGKIVENVREFVDSHYVEEADRLEYEIDNRASDIFYGNNFDPSERRYLMRERRERLGRSRADRQEICEEVSAQTAPAPEAEKTVSQKVDIKKLLAASDKTFQEKLFEIIDERGLKDSEVYKNYVSKQVFSKIRADREYHPNKYTAIALCLSLHLDVEATQDLIGRAGWTLSPSSKADLVVKGCILNEEFNVVKINCILFDMNLSQLEKIK